MKLSPKQIECFSEFLSYCNPSEMGEILENTCDNFSLKSINANQKQLATAEQAESLYYLQQLKVFFKKIDKLK